MEQLLTMNYADRWKVVFVVWAALGLFMFLSWQLSPPEQRRRLRPYSGMVTGLIFLGAAWWADPRANLSFLVIAVPLIVGFSLYRAQTMRTCPNCGAEFNRAAAFCSKCGSALDD